MLHNHIWVFNSFYWFELPLVWEVFSSCFFCCMIFFLWNIQDDKSYRRQNIVVPTSYDMALLWGCDRMQNFLPSFFTFLYEIFVFPSIFFRLILSLNPSCNVTFYSHVCDQKHIDIILNVIYLYMVKYLYISS